MKTLKYVLVRVLFFIFCASVVINTGVKSNADLITIISVLLFIACSFLLVTILFEVFTNDTSNYKKQDYSYNRNYRQWKEPYRWQSGIDY